MTYQPKIYRQQGAATMTVASGGTVDVESGGIINLDSGASLVHPVSTVGTSATTITADGLSIVTGTTVGPTFLIANPRTGVVKYIHLTSTSSGVTHRAIIAPASTGVSFDTTGANQITLATSALRGVTLIGESTSAYRVVGVHVVGTAGLGNRST